MKLLVADAATWKPHGDGTTYTWNVRTIPSNPARLVKARVAGTLMALGVVWYGMAFHPISFFMFGLCVASFNDLKNLDFIRSIDGTLADELSEWPIDAQVPFASAPSMVLQSLLVNHLQMMVCGLLSWRLYLIGFSFQKSTNVMSMKGCISPTNSLHGLCFRLQPSHLISTQNYLH